MNVNDFISKQMVDLIKKHKSFEADNFGLIPYLVEHNNEHYYYVHYKQSDRYLIIRKDGFIPKLETIKPVINLAAFLVAIDHAFHRYGKKWVKA
ncbi:hypothetical protein [Paludifilum halophilum]|uniref:Uncharacterized protein n=1 Tax=Paludifilum halophilum TaxID=1642702 RepID=A0A235B1F6_9BACL|nr:hypothetical protein [Paludifilum halophilum]OYD06136.1 hypothetical protein CHM34_17940 [Paludifilum halophilum]